MKLERLSQQFDNVSEFVRFCEVEPRRKGSARDGRSLCPTSFSEVCRLAREGWPEGLKQAERIIARIEKRLIGKMIVPEVAFDVTGDWLDVGRYVTGEPEVFGEFVDTETPHEAPSPKVLRVVVNISVSSSISSETIMMRGAAMTALVDILERHGRRVEIDVIDSTRSNATGETFLTTVQVKDAGELLQLDKVVFMLAHPGSERRLMFAAEEHADPDVVRDFNFYYMGGYGRPTEAPETLRGDIYLPQILSGHSWTEAETWDWIVNTLDRFRVKLQTEN